MKKTVTFIFISLLFISLSAQNKQLTINDVVIGSSNYSSFYPQKLNKLQWADTEHYSYVKDDSTLILSSTNGKEKAILTTNEIKAVDSSFTASKIPNYKWHNGQEIELFLKGKRLFYNPYKHSSWEINYPQDAKHLDLSYETKQLAYTIGNNLYYANSDNNQNVITNDPDTGIVNGQSVHRNEFGINKGIFWSPDGQSIAFYHKDESMVGDYPLVDVNAREAKATLIKYPMAGMASQQVSIGIYNTDNKTTTYLQTGKADDHYLTNIAWSPDNKTIYVAELNRAQDTLHFNSYNATDGHFIKTLFVETDKEYVEPLSPMLFLPHHPTQFIWQSRRDGYNHLYLYSTDGTLIRQITKGDWEVTDILGFDKNEKHVFISSTEKSYLERHTYAIDINKDAKTCLTKHKGYHKSKLSPEGKYVLDVWSDIEIPLVTDLISIKNDKSTTLLKADNPYQDYTLGQIKMLSVKSADGETDLACRMILPPNFDTSEKYPVIIYVYGGPHSQMMNSSWQGNVRKWQLYMAQKGYIMFCMDNRGTSYRGADFEQVIHRHLGKNEMEDQIKGYEYLTSLPYVDSDRIGIFGWSYGGFMTTSLMTHYPDAFKVGVAGGPVIDWSNYEIMYGERYMDTPQENPDGYAESNVCKYAKDLKGRLLIIHGGQDPTVVWQHSQKFLNECIKDGVQLDYFVYPNHQHNVRGQDRVHLMEKITRYFDDFL